MKQKKLLVLGGTSASVDVVKVAKNEGIYTIITDNLEGGVAKPLADEVAKISTTDIEGLVHLIQEKEIDGVFCGPSEFNILNAIRVAKAANLPFYCNEEQWDMCSDKESFKQMCRKHNVPCVPEYQLSIEHWKEDVDKIDFPVIVKPADSCSSRGISVCYEVNQLEEAYQYALGFSNRKKVLVEKYIDNNIALAVRYLIYNGKVYLSLVNDRYTVGTKSGIAMISGFAVYPSLRTDEYIDTIDANVKEMIESIGLKNGSLFMQALIDPANNNIYFHEMGLRLSGGLTYKLTEPTTGINDMKMMIRYMVGEEFATEEEIKKVDPYLGQHYTASLCVPLKPGKIAYIEGVEKIKKDRRVSDFVQYYKKDDEVLERMMGTLDQHFCRVKFVVDSYEELDEMVKWIQDTLVIKDEKEEDMIYMYFDTNRLKKK